MSDKYQIIETSKFDLISDILHNSHDESLILLDIDDTIITPKSHMFRAGSRHKTIVDDIKKMQHQIPNYLEMLEHWRRTREIMLIHDDWPDLIKQIMEQGKKIYALTQMHTGPFGNIPRMEEWRYNELLREVGVSFVEKFNNKEEIEILPETDFNQSSGLSTPAVFYKGYFMTGGHGKDDVLRMICQYLQPPEIIFVDDRKDHVERLHQVCKEHDIEYRGIIYKGAELVPGNLDHELAEFQREYWFKHSKWLEDEEARKMLK